jgi:hypothetical protein
MLLSLPALSRDGFSANAHGCRQYPEALELLSSLGRAHELPHLVVIALGANGTIEEGDIRRALAILGPDRLLVLLTPRQLGGGSGPNAELVRAEARRHPEQVVALDWVAFSAGHPSWFQPDGLHLTLPGAAAFASLIARVLPLASPPRSLREPRCTSTASASHLPLSGVTHAVRGGALKIGRRSAEVHVTLTNANPFPLDGVASLRLAAGTRPVIATSCLTVAPRGTALVTLRIEPQAREDLELLGRYRTRLVMQLLGPEGQTATLASPQILVQARNSPS